MSDHRPDREHQEQRALQHEILSRLSDLAVDQPDHLALALVNGALAVLAKAHPAVLDVPARRKIKENYPAATPTLLRERAMAPDGVVRAMFAGVQLVRIANDYSPLSNVREFADADYVQDDVAARTAGEVLVTAYHLLRRAGLTPFGAATAMVFHGAETARQDGVHPFQLVRPLVDAIEMVVAQTAAPPESPAAPGERVGARASTKRYAKMAKQRLAGGASSRARRRAQPPKERP